MANAARGRGGRRVASRGAVLRDESAGGHDDAAAGGSGEGVRQDRGNAEAWVWPAWAKAAVSALVVVHLAAVLAGAVGAPPSSELERAIADGFLPYFDAIDAGHTYRFYAEPGPTPVVTATITYGDGRPEETVRLPERNLSGPRMRHQRQLALANALNDNVREARHRTGDPSQSVLARAYARHLCRTRPGCVSVTIRLQQHLYPDPAQARDELESAESARVDLFAERLFTTPERVGEFSCDDL